MSFYLKLDTPKGYNFSLFFKILCLDYLIPSDIGPERVSVFQMWNYLVKG